MTLAAVDWTYVIVALIAGLPAIIAAIRTGRVLKQIKTPSGAPLGHVVEYAHDTAIANNMLLRAANGHTVPAEPGQLHEEGATPPAVPESEPPL